MTDRPFSAKRRRFVTALAASALPLGLTPFAAHAQTSYPDRPIKLVIGYTPGGAGDALARVMAQKYSEVLSQPVMVENRPGASATLAATSVAKGLADGYTLLVNTAPDTALAPFTMGDRLQYNVARDFAPVGLVVTVPSVLVVPSSSPYRSVNDIVKAAKANPGKLNYASFGNGSSAHMAAELLKSIAGVDIVHIPFKGSAPAMVDLLAGRIDFLFDTFASAWPHIQAGKLRALGVTGSTRVPLAPQLPTMEELGLRGCIWQSFIGITAPAATPAPALERLYRETARIVAMPDVKQRITAMGMIPGNAIGRDYAAFIASETERSGKLIRDAKIHFE
jgi:tripartite-type tricarboxylate transporter receptor subunit TctC